MEVPLQRHQLVFFAAAMGTAFIVLLTVFGQRGVMEVFALKRKAKATAEESSFYKRRNMELRELIEKLKHDPYTIEQIAREELGLVKPGETVYEFVDEAKASGASPTRSLT
jgi:cell division protein FtsB